MNNPQILREITIIVPAFHEQENIEAAIQSVIGALQGIVDDYEIIVFDDGSSDETYLRAQAQAQKNVKIKVIQNEKNQGYGYCYRKGVMLATKSYVSVFPGDNDMAQEGLRDIVKNIGQADVVYSYPLNHDRRGLMRTILSKAFVAMINAIAGLNARYYTGGFACKTDLVRSLSLETNGLAIGAECLVKLLRSGHSFKEIALEHIGRKHGASKALTWNSFCSVVKTIAIVFKVSYGPKRQDVRR